MNPYTAYMTRKVAFDLSALADVGQHVAHNPLVHAGLLTAGGHLLSNAVTNFKNWAPVNKHVGPALAEMGARYGLHGRRLNPAVEAVVNNVAGPEFLGREFGQAHAQATKALGLAGGDKVKALGYLRDAQEMPGRKDFAEKFRGTATATKTLANLDDGVLKRRMLPGMHTANTPSALNRNLARAGHVASTASAAAVDPGATLSIAWNQAKTKLFHDREWRNHPLIKSERSPLKFLDIADEASQGFARGLKSGPDRGIRKVLGKTILSPEYDTFSHLGHEVATNPHLARQLPPSMRVTPENKPEIIRHFQGHGGRKDMDEGLEFLKDTFQPHAKSTGGVPFPEELNRDPRGTLERNVHVKQLLEDPRAHHHAAAAMADPRVQAMMAQFTPKQG